MCAISSMRATRDGYPRSTCRSCSKLPADIHDVESSAASATWSVSRDRGSRFRPLGTHGGRGDRGTVLDIRGDGFLPRAGRQPRPPEHGAAPAPPGVGHCGAVHCNCQTHRLEDRPSHGFFPPDRRARSPRWCRGRPLPWTAAQRGAPGALPRRAHVTRLAHSTSPTPRPSSPGSRPTRRRATQPHRPPAGPRHRGGHSPTRSRAPCRVRPPPPPAPPQRPPPPPPQPKVILRRMWLATAHAAAWATKPLPLPGRLCATCL